MNATADARAWAGYTAGIFAMARRMLHRRRSGPVSDPCVSVRCDELAEDMMPEQETINRARQDAREGKSPSTQAGEFVREEMDHIREGKHGARSAKQAIAIGLSKARRAGVKLGPPKKGTTSAQTRRQAARDTAKGHAGGKPKVSKSRSDAALRALRREGHSAASPEALAKQARSSARHRTATQRSASARDAARTKGQAGRSAAAKKGARTRARHG
jgi:hypothetical protein